MPARVHLWSAPEEGGGVSASLAEREEHTRMLAAMRRPVKAWVLEVVREAGPWRYTVTGLKTAVERAGCIEGRAAITYAIHELLAEGKLIRDAEPERKRGMKMRLRLPDEGEHATEHRPLVQGPSPARRSRARMDRLSEEEGPDPLEEDDGPPGKLLKPLRW